MQQLVMDLLDIAKLGKFINRLCSTTYRVGVTMVSHAPFFRIWIT
jgi:hypothetical protein